MPTMPRGLVPNVAAYSHDDPGGVMQTEVEGGDPRFGLSWDRGKQRYGITILMSLDEYSVWVAFYHHVIRKGAITFDMELDTGFGTRPHPVNIVPGSYSGSRTGGNCMMVAFTVLAQTQAYEMTASEAAAYVALHDGGALEPGFFARLARFATVDTLALDFE